MKSGRCVIVIALLLSIAFPALALAQAIIPDHPRTLSWDELAEHAGLKALKKKDQRPVQT
jgi:hypothetical protein